MKQNVYIVLPLNTRVSNRSKRFKGNNQVELEKQKEINADLQRVCKSQQQLLDEQSGMIIDILNSMGRPTI